MCWLSVCNEEHPHAALDAFMKLLCLLLRNALKALWIDEELKSCMDEAKGMTSKSCCTADWQTHCKLRQEETIMKLTNKLYKV